MKEQKKLIPVYLIAFLAIAFSVVCLLTTFSRNPYTADLIYTDCINNVVEVKAASEGVGESFGTAELISQNGLLITNAHVVTYTRLGKVNLFEEYAIRFSDEEDYRPVTLQKFDTDKDIAVLKIETESIKLKPVKIGNSSELRFGDKIYAVGNASNYGIGIFEGIVSVPLVNIEIDGNTRSVIQCDLTIAAGNSGGALLNAKGELVGITTFRTKDNSGNVIYGIVYCIPVNEILEFTDI